METRRYLCSQLATLTLGGQAQWVNIEEIWETGVILESEAEVPGGTQGSLSVDGASFQGRVGEVRQEEFGWRVEMEFSPETPWSPERWRPDHLLDPAALRQK